MERTQAVAALRQNAAAVRAFGATALYLFGSTARDEAADRSDLDVFVDYNPSSMFSLVELVGIRQLLESRLGVPVDVTTRDSLHSLLREQIESSAERIF